MCEQKCNNIQIVPTCCKEKMGKCRKTFTSHVYLENTHFKSLWSNIYQNYTESRRFLSFLYDPLGFISPNHFVNLHHARVRYVTNLIHSLFCVDMNESVEPVEKTQLSNVSADRLPRECFRTMVNKLNVLEVKNICCGVILDL